MLPNSWIRPSGRIINNKKKDMETMIQMGTIGIPTLPLRERRVHITRTPEVKISMPERGSTGPVRVGKLLEPIQQIINHPDRNRLLAEFFKDYK